MSGILSDNFAVVKARKDLERRLFGEKRGDKIILHPVEAVYLASKGAVNLGDLEEIIKWAKKAIDNFSTIYFVYEDLRNRGQRVRISGEYLLSRKVYWPVSERSLLSIPEVATKSRNFENFVIAIVDEESEITYFQTYEVDLGGEQIEDIPEISGHLLEDRIITYHQEIFERFFYGSKKENFVTLSLIESVYLVERGVMTVYDSEKVVDLDTLISLAMDIESEFTRKYEVYKDLKERGFVVKTGFKFGSDFRAYSRVESVSDLPHSEYLITIVDDRRLKTSEITRAVRLAQSVRKKMIFVFRENDRNRYLCIERVKV
jgi:tRNA-intron endonuclease